MFVYFIHGTHTHTHMYFIYTMIVRWEILNACFVHEYFPKLSVSFISTYWIKDRITAIIPKEITWKSWMAHKSTDYSWFSSTFSHTSTHIQRSSFLSLAVPVRIYLINEDSTRNRSNVYTYSLQIFNIQIYSHGNWFSNDEIMTSDWKQSYHVDTRTASFLPHL